MTDISSYFPSITIDEYLPIHGGNWYYTQNKPGTPWFDKVDNTKGWTVDFNLRIDSIENSSSLTTQEPPDGLGLYVNDGTKYETLYFLTQEIIFNNSKEKVVRDTTQSSDYRLTGKNDNLTLYVKNFDDSSYEKIAETKFKTLSTNQSNGYKPRVYEDSSGNLHVVWFDDGNSVGQIYYSKFDGNSWSAPELVESNSYGAKNPDVLADNNNIYVIFETQESSESSIAFRYKTEFGWSDKIFIGDDNKACYSPKIAFDSNGNIAAVWEDHRHNHPEIYYAIWRKNELLWEEPVRLTTTVSGAYRPSITSYFDRIFVAWSQHLSSEKSQIYATYFETSYSSIATPVLVSNNYNQADYPDIQTNASGRVFVVWHDNYIGTWKYEIYGRILDPGLNFVTDIDRITISHGYAKYPVLSEQTNTSDMYIVWQDSVQTADFSQATDPYDPYYYDPYREDIDALWTGRILVAYYNFSEKKYYSSGQGSFDVVLVFPDQRNPSMPAVANTFSSELPVIYQSLFAKTNDFMTNAQTFSEIRYALYNLSRSSETYLVVDEEIDPYDPYSANIVRDMLINGYYLRKEIRFGDFSNTLSVHAVFGELKYYLDDAVEPLEITEVTETNFDDSLLAMNDAVVSNYGDSWMVGNCGIFFYWKDNNQLANISSESSISGVFRCISFDKNNSIVVGGYVLDGTTHKTKMYYSTDHVDNYYSLDIDGYIGSDVTGEVTAIAFDKNNNIYVGTKSSGLYIASMPDLYDGGDQSATLTKVLSVSGGELPSDFITSIQVDSNSIVWIGTRNGLVRYYNESSRIYKVANGLPSNRINDITIRNTAIRYIATANGIAKMIGTSFEVIGSEAGDIWNNNVKSISWREPNILWAGTLSAINQIIVDDETNSYTTTIFEPQNYSSFADSYDGLTVYYILSEDIDNMTADEKKILNNCLTEVYLNGKRISYGYNVVYYPIPLIQFTTPLKATDVVDVVIRTDVKLLSSFYQSDAEKQAIGARLLRIKDVQCSSDVYAVTEGENEILINDASTSLPYDRVHLDTTPPTGKISNAQQLTRSVVKVYLSDVTDGEYGSGVSKMIISNYENFTTDGSTSQTSVDYDPISNHDLGLYIDTSSQILDLGSSTGNVIEMFTSDTGKELYAGASLPGIVYQYSFITNDWTALFSYGNEKYVDFIAKYNNKLIIGVGDDNDVASLYVYDYEYDDTGNYTGFSSPQIIAISESHAYCSTILNNILYIGSGPGFGDEYGAFEGTNGRVYSFDGTNLTLIVSGLDRNVYDLTATSNALFAVTGTEGRVYRVDVEDKDALIVHTDSDSGLLSIEDVTYSDTNYLFAGAETEGKILRSLITSFSFDYSFKTMPGASNVIKKFTVGENEVAYASVGSVLYHFDENGTWVWDYTHSETIEDMTYNPDTDILYVISSNNVTKIEPLGTTKTIYLKLIDRAGNTTNLYDSSGNIKSDLKYDIDISSLSGYVNENKIFELDSVGNILNPVNGDTSFYSADKIEQEKGVYESEIFDGTNDLIKWDSIYWEATQPTNTTVYLYIRTSTSSTDILSEDWIGPFTMSQSLGVDISYLTGQFIQFKVVLLSTEKDVSPTFSRCTIRAMTGESVHFFTTNFVMPSSPRKGIITSKELLPVAADIVYGVNTTNSVDWTDYQIVDENRLFNVNQTGENLRIGIKLLSPSRTAYETPEFGEYGPYQTDLFVNVINFDVFNNTGDTQDYNFIVSLYSDYDMTDEVYSIDSRTSNEGFSSGGSTIGSSGLEIFDGDTESVLFSVPASAGIRCNDYYYVKVQSVYNDGTDHTNTILSGYSFIGGCSASFVDTIEFEFSNTSGSTHNYHFRIRFYTNPERTNHYMTVYSGNDRTGWFADGSSISETGVNISSGDSSNILYRPDLTDFTSGTIYYMTIDAFDGSNFGSADDSYSFQARGFTDLVYCGEYYDVPVVKNFGILFELENGEFVTLNT